MFMSEEEITKFVVENGRAEESKGKNKKRTIDVEVQETNKKIDWSARSKELLKPKRKKTKKNDLTGLLRQHQP